MIFDSHFWIFSLFASLVGAAFTAFLIWNPEKLGCRISEPHTWTRKNLASIEFAAVLSFVVTLLAVRTLLYYGMPVFQGSFFGYFEVLLVVLLSSNAVAWLLKMNPSNIKYLLLCYLGLFIMPVSIHLMTANWGKANSKRYAELPNIRQVADTETLPPTDPSHMVLVNRDIAVF
ncbi:MAG TPA: solute carrier family 23 protein, partial [Candidatus Obscuribacter sp.]|nr:solute carrier family 23 protein [Candidatus Obscuribacter sp.]